MNSRDIRIIAVALSIVCAPVVASTWAIARTIDAAESRIVERIARLETRSEDLASRLAILEQRH